MKLLFILFLLPFASTPISYRQLSWSDFKGNPPANTEAYACTCTNIAIGYDTAYAIFLPERSWTKTSDPEVLRHEQLHFTITQWWARKLNQFRVYDEVEHEYSRNIPFWLDRWRSMQQKYDAETDHGTDMAAQKRWEETIKL